MGTQQILLIVLSVIIVGVAIAVGISMFNSQAYNSNKTAIASDAQSFATQIVQYYKTPTSQGGFGGGTATDADGDPIELDADAIAAYLGFTGGSITNENGTYTLSIVAGAPTITGIGQAVKSTGGVEYNPQIITTITLPSGEVTAEAGDAAVAGEEEEG